MLISVIIPTHKPAAYIYECLDSLTRQTLDHGLFEVIVVLNGCAEPYLSDLRRHVSAMPQMAVSVVQTDVAGVSNARNVGIGMARGEHVAFVDDDDWLSPDYLACLAALAGDGVLPVARVVQVDETTGAELPHYVTRAYDRCSALANPSLFAARSFFSSAWAKLIPRKAIGRHRFDTRYALGEDALFMFQVSRDAGRVRLAPPTATYFVRKRASSVSHRRYPYSFRVKLALSLSLTYLATYLKSPARYNLPFMLSRIAATLLKLTQKGYAK